MPYELKGNCVHKVGDPKPIKCHPNKAAAMKHMAALALNVTMQETIKKWQSERQTDLPKPSK